MKNIIRVSAMLSGTTIGAGIFGIPYAISKVGFGIGLLYLLGLGLVVLLLNLAYSQVVLSTEGKHQLSYYTEKYLGKLGKLLAILSLFFGLYGAQTAYLIKIGQFIKSLISFINLSFFAWSFLYFIPVAIIIFLGLKIVYRLEIFIISFLILSFLGLFIFCFRFVDFSNLTYLQTSNIFLPYGVILFAYGGASVIPEMSGVIQHKKHLKIAIIIGTLLPIILYTLFTLLVVGITGKNTSDDAVTGLIHLHPALAHLGAFLGILTMTGSYLNVGMILLDHYHYDFKLSKVFSWVLACFPPIIIFFIGLREFITVIGIAGALMGGFEGIVILKSYLKVKILSEKKPAYTISFPKFISHILIGIFVLGIIYKIISLI